MQLKKKLFLILACVVSICCLMAAKSSDNSEIEQVLNDFFETKEMNFASSEDISLNNFFTTYTRETLTTKTLDEYHFRYMRSFWLKAVSIRIVWNGICLALEYLR